MRSGSRATPAPPAAAIATPARPLVAAVRAQQRQRGEVARLLQPACQGRRTQRREGGIENRRAGLALPVAVTAAERQVQPFAGQGDAVVVGLQAQLDVRMRSLECGQPWQQPAGGEGADHAQRQHLTRGSAGVARDAGRDALERFVEHGIQRRPLIADPPGHGSDGSTPPG
ncbi:hypothetical protein G6F57_018751 [Rhizopus arrhizus]|nr:hypothetical protein G6F57_018751 [Rhizopus arrhizus]